MSSEQYTIEDDLIDGEEAGIGKLYFELREARRGVIFVAYMNPSEDVIDASEEDFPQFECELTIEQFKSLAKMFLRFDEKVVL